MTGIFLVSAVLRFWGLERFNTLVFDEVYYAKFANNYLTQTPFFDGHPPLSKYIIAIGMWIGDQLPFGKQAVNGLTGSVHSPWSYRWLNALTGSFIPLVVGGIAYQLSHRRSYALIAALFAAADGLFLVESRYALNNVYLVIFGLLGQLCFLVALNYQGMRRWVWLGLAGVWFGATAAIKWNGLWFLLGAYFIWGAAWVLRIAQSLLRRQGDKAMGEVVVPDQNSFSTATARTNLFQTPLQNLTQLNVLHIVWNFAIIPFAVYALSWIPHLKLSPQFGFWEVQRQILVYHQKVQDGPKVHPYCSDWYTWPFMLRPVAYFYQTARTPDETVPALPPLPAGTGQVIYDVHAMGNPILWWLSTVAILMVIVLLGMRLLSGEGWKQNPSVSTWLVLYLVLNYAANLLPWTTVTRCVFLYHYMGSSVFAGLALAWIVDRWLWSYEPELGAISVTVIFLILLAFVFWMPIYLGLPLSPEAYQLRLPRLDVSTLPRWLQKWVPKWI